MGPLISSSQEKIVLDYIKLGQDAGFELVTGGEKLTGGEYDHGYYVEPTIFDRVDNSSSLSPNPPMDGARIGGRGEEVTDATVRARIRVDWRLAGGLSALLGVLIAACDGCGERDGGIGHGKKHSRTGPGASWRGS